MSTYERTALPAVLKERGASLRPSLLSFCVVLASISGRLLSRAVELPTILGKSGPSDDHKGVYRDPSDALKKGAPVGGVVEDYCFL